MSEPRLLAEEAYLMRIVSLLPAATEWLCAFGLRHALVGRSHACDYPADVADVPVLTSAPRLDATDSAVIDSQVKGMLQRGLSLYEVDLEQLKALQPDLIVTQALCDVCAVSLSALEATLADWTGNRPKLFSMEPMSMKQVLDTALRLGRTTGRISEAMHVIMQGERRLKQLHEHLGIRRTSAISTFPTIVCIEWMEPLMTAGHWMPDVAAQAGLHALTSTSGARSAYITWEDIKAADPDYLAIIPCGFDLDATERDAPYLTERSGWHDLRAVQNGTVVSFDGNAYFNRPGPRLYRAVELLALAFHTNVSPLMKPTEAWELQAWAA